MGIRSLHAERALHTHVHIFGPFPAHKVGREVLHEAPLQRGFAKPPYTRTFMKSPGVLVASQSPNTEGALYRDPYAHFCLFSY